MPHAVFAYRVYNDAKEGESFRKLLSEKAPSLFREMHVMRQESVTNTDPPLFPQEIGPAGERFIRVASLVLAWLQSFYGRIPLIPTSLPGEIHEGCKVEDTISEYRVTLSLVDPAMMNSLDIEAFKRNIHPRDKIHIYALGVAFKIAAEKEQKNEEIAPDVAKGTAILASNFPGGFPADTEQESF